MGGKCREMQRGADGAAESVTVSHAGCRATESGQLEWPGNWNEMAPPSGRLAPPSGLILAPAL